MKLLKPVLLFALVAGATLPFVATAAAATERPPRVGEERIVAPKPGAAKPVPLAPAKKPLKRRAARQVLDDGVRPVSPPTGYAPQLTPPPSTPAGPGVAPSPLILNCVGATCIDSNGGRYNSGVGTTLISPQGRLCNNSGVTVQCF